MDNISIKKLSSVLKLLDRNNVTVFRLGELEIHRTIVDNDMITSVDYQPLNRDQKDLEYAIDELQELDDENLMINDPEEYERRQTGNV